MNTGTVAALTALATLLLFSSVLVCSAGAPALPCEFYGTVTIDGSPAPVGTILSAKINDAERGRYVLEEAGKYGGPGTFDQRLKIVAEDSDLSGGSPKVTFWIDGQKAWQETTFQPGISLNLDLSIGGEAPSVTSIPAETTEIVPEESTEKTGEEIVSDPVIVDDKTESKISEPAISDMPPQLPEMMNPVVTEPPVSSVSPLVADFIADPLSGMVPLTVTFTDLSIGGPTLWSWDFGDGTTDTISNPVHQYMLPGTYSVTLTVSNTDGSASIIKEQYITASGSGGILKADFTATPVTGQAPLKVQFTDKSSGSPTLFAWSFGDGTGDSAQNPVHTYDKDGKYSVNLTVADAVGLDSTESKEDYIVVGPITPKPTMTPIAVPSVPQTFVGTIEIYGTPIQSGGTVEARAPGYELSGQFNPIKTAKGVFGKIGTFSPKLQVQGIPEGTEIEFYVADQYNRMSRAYILQDDGSYLWTVPYQPGQETILRLAVLKNSPEEIPPIPVTPSPTECAGIPSIPMSIQGDVRITDGTEFLDAEGVCHNCQPNIRVGGQIEARIDGYDVSGPENPFTMVSAAYFGSGNSSWADKLTIQGKCLPDDAKITFWVKDDGWPQYTQAWLINENTDDNETITYLNETREIPYEGGISRTVHLWAGPLPTVPQTPTPTPTPAAWEPQHFYGKAEFNGYPLRVGDRVMATREGIDLSNPTNPVSVLTFGEYGNPVEKDMLTVDVPYGSIEQRDPISFWIKPQEYEYWYKAEVKNPLSSAPWSDTYPFTPGSITNLDLMSSDRADFMYFDDIVESISNVILPDDYSGW
ncbi:PKD domain-containing protein [Methanospirillum stamsii]|uniref:PKD domain-containing protein n=1 Tax=Methanospirillum stamsii TaxID=1277351 RepID=A0A2V2NF97_9EURY|nr:PKD domain-containing protein [Methanospirillum stamsii]PWR76236.1 hypothetical protein DLD82_00020 [Methanospirillum stamsii]